MRKKERKVGRQVFNYSLHTHSQIDGYILYPSTSKMCLMDNDTIVDVTFKFGCNQKFNVMFFT